MTGRLSIETARPEDFDDVLTILDDAAAWLRGQGVDQWPESFSKDATWRIDRIRTYIEHGLTYLARDEAGEVVGTFTLSRAADPQFAHGWPDGPDNAGYLFRMAVRRSAAGDGVGEKIMDWATAKVADWGLPWLRIDVHRFNRKLQDYYRRRGFEKVAEVTAPDLSVPGRIRGSGALMQRPAMKGMVAMEPKLSFDPDGSAEIWLAASNCVRDMITDNPPKAPDAWNAALDQAARALQRHASEIRRANGMYRSSPGDDEPE